MSGAFVDCHSHVVPSGDDGARSVEEGIALCREAARRGTSVLFATPHIWPHYPLTREREGAVREAYSAMAPAAGLELRLGFELSPAAPLLDEDPRRYVLDGADAVLMEVPFEGPLDVLWALAEHVEAAGLTPVIAHPERTEAVVEDREVVARLAERGWLLQVNASSLLGYHGAWAEELAWDLLEGGHVALVASDGHRTGRPPHLDDAHAAAVVRLGPDATRFFDGSALGLAAPRTPEPV